MRNIGIFLMLLTLTAGVVQAQPRNRNFDPEAMAKRQTQQIDEAVDLTGEQEEKVFALNMETGKKMRALREKYRQGDRTEGMREKFTAIREEQNKKMAEILSEEQMEKYNKYLEERRARYQNRRPRDRR